VGSNIGEGRALQRRNYWSTGPVDVRSVCSWRNLTALHVL